MKSEDFEHKLRSHDPAANLEMRDSAEHRALLDKAISGQPANVIPMSSWTKRRKAVSAAAAALLVVGFGGPVISGSATATPERLVFGSSAPSLSGKMADSGLRNESMTSGHYDNLGGAYTYELLGEFADLPTTAPVYKVVNIANVEARIKEIAASLGVKDLSKADYEDAWAAENFWGFTNEGGASFSYYDGSVDPWRDCYKEGQAVTSDGEFECEPIVENLPTKQEAISKTIALMEKLGISTSDLRVEVSEYGYSVDVYAVVQVNGQDSPISYFASYVSNGDLYSFGGSLTKMVELGTYDLVDANFASERANALTNRNIEAWNKEVNSSNEPGAVVSESSEDGEVSEPSEPGSEEPTLSDEPTISKDEPIGPDFEYKSIKVKVSKVELSYQSFWMKDGTSLWLPVFEFWGTTDHLNDVVSYGNVVAIVDSQIDLDSLYGIYNFYGPLI